ncbi:MAG: phenylalanyl-tRNA synthetase alpha chain [Patescibacteria group bacterium]|jgi:phenylalanyl-tRNA synthetase alpha chain|nr:phenylalanyl-tRNA synthetase alpha chain [Patescibacteria group bacterium]
MEEIHKTRELLLEKLESLEEKRSILRAPELRALYGKIKDQPEDQRAAYGQAVNQLKIELEELVSSNIKYQISNIQPIDVTAPFDVNAALPELLPTENGTIHPITAEIEKITDIFYRMGFEVSESREIDDEYHMFTSLNFPEGHPARDDYDTFMTEEDFVAPAHTSTMQNRIIKARKDKLEQGEPIAVLAVDRVFRNEDLDARHEHTFHQAEGIYVGKNITVGNLVATLKTFLTTYFGKEVQTKITPFYFPFTEPSFEFSLSCPFCEEGEECRVCSSERWIELLGCGMIHPNVLKEAGVDPEKYTGFAWGCGIERLVMMRYNIEDIRHFNSGKLAFLRQFK